ncbi:type II secretion system F family protein [Gulosibacter molinativorax]|uniref:Type II secretion system protein F n=1 Tax=Gulosibacter molinativorax TaxID=256821 RepID=A0ABT7CBG0_9MICO|nr:type II secretion system F family protein [Gulosibacter molinativorax]MDJ1372497.1 type II secretion system protein F [Gulosibacter molinativorax]QUY61925.1 Bacterial type II secretion system F domain protein [Gulosibacter molinativorax]
MVTAIALGLVAGAGLLLILTAILGPTESAMKRASREPAAIRRLREDLTRAGLERIPVVGFLFLALVIGLILGAIAVLATGILVLGLIGFIVGMWGALALVRWRSQQRRRANRAYWPDVVDHLIASVRSGLGLPDAIEQLAKTGPEPLREDFAAFARQYRATGSFNLAVDEAKERLADPVADRLLETLRMAREVGGTELVRVLRDFSAFLREEQGVRHEAEARQSWVLNAARLGVVAPWIVLVMLASRPEAAAAYNTPGGVIVIGIGVAVSVIAYRLMLALGRLREEGRWFA